MENKEYEILTPDDWEVYAREWELWTDGKLEELEEEHETHN